MNNKWQKIISMVSVAISLSALAISFFAFQVSREANRMAKNDYKANRKVVWKGEGQGQDSINILKISSHDQAMAMQFGEIIGPDEIFPHHIRIGLPNHVISLHAINYRLTQSLITNNKCMKQQYGILNLPIIIKSTYIAKNEIYSDCSLYFFQYNYFSFRGQEDRPQILFLGLIYGSDMKIREDEDGKFILNRLWNQEKETIILEKDENDAARP